MTQKYRNTIRWSGTALFDSVRVVHSCPVAACAQRRGLDQFEAGPSSRSLRAMLGGQRTGSGRAPSPGWVGGVSRVVYDLATA